MHTSSGDQAGEQHFYMGLAGERPVLKGGWQENGSFYRGGCLENNRGVERPMLQTCTEDAFAIPLICNSVFSNAVVNYANEAYDDGSILRLLSSNSA